MIRSKIQSSITLYKLWFFYKRGIKGQMRSTRLPNKLDSCYIDGYPRCGNTFFTGYLKYLEKDLTFASHLHSIAALKIASKAKLKTISLTRNPFDAVSSLVLMTTPNEIYNIQKLKSECEKRLLDYIKFYEYVYLQKDKLRIVDFNQIINPILCNQVLLDLLGIQASEVNYLQFKSFYEEHQNGKEAFNQMSPSLEKEKVKNNIKKVLVESSLSQAAQDLYVQITSNLESSSN